MSPAAPSLERLDVRVSGQVQGVGFRPFVFRLASELGLTGWVLNDGHGVQIQVQGERHRVQRFIEDMRRGPTRLSRVDAVDVATLGPIPERDFRIRESECQGVSTDVAPDSAACSACLDELFDPGDRRYRYAFTNCTQCGPRYTITRKLPYDRSNTSMDAFRLCAACGTEYRDPFDRRFHAEPNACPDCGPALSLLDGAGKPIVTADVVAATTALLLQGTIVAIKGLGGFHLACDARNAEAVGRLRDRKHRDSKPLAIMVGNTVSIAEFVDIAADARALLHSPERPIVLLPKRAACDGALPDVAPGVDCLGVMFPYTPLHYLLFHEAAGRPEGRAWLEHPQPLGLVMTSANPSGEPLVRDNDEALDRLGGLADVFLVHDRDILERCDDSVLRAAAPAPVFVRRARGYTPIPLPLPRSGPSVLAVGGTLKNTVCLTRGNRAYLSQHIGDLESRAARLALEHAVDHLTELLDVTPKLVARDLHPDYASSEFAESYARRNNLPVVTVQHHHAHVAAVIAEWDLRGQVLGLALDGVGLGKDGGAWGGELLLVEETCERLGHLAMLALPGGDAGAREPWRMAASALHALGRGDELEARWPNRGARVLGQMLERGVNCPPTSSAGRLFDAAAGLLHVRDKNHYEAQAAMELEALARRHGDVEAMAGGYRLDASGILDFRPLLARLADTVDQSFGAALFHATFAEGLAVWVRQSASARKVDQVVLAGGCMLNAVLASRLRAALAASGLRVFEARALPPNDGALSYGQSHVALSRLAHAGDSFLRRSREEV